MLGPEHPAHEDLLLFHGGELDPAAAKTVEQHLVNCQACPGELSRRETFYKEVASASRPSCIALRKSSSL